MVLSIILSFIIGLGHYLSDRFCLTCSKYKTEIISFTAGVSITYIFLQLLPELYNGVIALNRFLFIFVLLGFVLFHLVEKYIYQNIPYNKVPGDLKLTHSIGLTIYYIVVGIVLVKFINKNAIEGILFFIPVFLHAIISSLSSHGIHGLYGPHYRNEKWTNLLQSSAAIIGVIIALNIAVSDQLSFALTGLVAGILSFIVVRDILPKDKKGKPLFFILGAILYGLIIVILWYI